MAFLQFVRTLFTGAAAPAADLSFGLIEARGIRPLLEQQQWSAFEVLALCLASSDLTRLLDGLALSHAYAPLLAQYQQSGSSELRRLLAAVHETFLAWESRGGGGGASLSQAQVDGFVQHLEQAQAYLLEPFATPGLQAEAYARLVRVSMGLSDTEQLESAFEHCTALQPNHLQGHLFFFNAITPKWFGSEEVLQEFVDAAPDPALHSLLQAMYLTEQLFGVDDKSDVEKKNLYDANASRIQESLTQQPLADDSLYAVYFNNYHACLNHVLGRPAARRQFLQVLCSRITANPWAYFGFTPAAVRKMSTATK